MIPERIQALFEFIDFLDFNKKDLIEIYLPLCNEISLLAEERSQLKPDNNYKDKLRYDIVQAKISEKFTPITENIYKPVVTKLLDLGIWAGDAEHSSFWNNNVPAISDFKRDFNPEDIPTVLSYKKKYLDFRTETNSNFLSLQMIFQDLDEVLKELFDFFKDTDENEFDYFETKTIEVGSMEEAARAIVANKDKNVKFSIPHSNLSTRRHSQSEQSQLTTIKNIFNMGDNIHVGGITGNSGQIIIGKEIRIAESFNDRKDTADKITELIDLVRNEQGFSSEQKQSLVDDFTKVKTEILSDQPDKSKIATWLANVSRMMDKLVHMHHITKAVQWLFDSLNFVAKQF